jgi:hypothetical protein
VSSRVSSRGARGARRRPRHRRRRRPHAPARPPTDRVRARRHPQPPGRPGDLGGGDRHRRAHEHHGDARVGRWSRPHEGAQRHRGDAAVRRLPEVSDGASAGAEVHHRRVRLRLHRPGACSARTRRPATPPKHGFAKDATEIEGYARAFGRRRKDVDLTILRFANFVGGRMDSAFHAMFTLPVIPTTLGFDPRLQFCHEEDAIGGAPPRRHGAAPRHVQRRRGRRPLPLAVRPARGAAPRARPVALRLRGRRAGPAQPSGRHHGRPAAVPAVREGGRHHPDA